VQRFLKLNRAKGDRRTASASIGRPQRHAFCTLLAGRPVTVGLGADSVAARFSQHRIRADRLRDRRAAITPVQSSRRPIRRIRSSSIRCCLRTAVLGFEYAVIRAERRRCDLGSAVRRLRNARRFVRHSLLWTNCKWLRLYPFVCMLPHGYEAGDRNSLRASRTLPCRCARKTISQVVYATFTPATVTLPLLAGVNCIARFAP